MARDGPCGKLLEAREEVTDMLSEPTTKNGRVTRKPPLPAVRAEESVLRRQAVNRLERVRRFKLHVVSFAVGMLILTPIWVLSEYQNAEGWPDRFSDSAGPDTWNPWLFWVFIVWGGIVAIHGVKTYFRREPTEAEIRREVQRLKAGS
jgi:hypothetical protein